MDRRQVVSREYKVMMQPDRFQGDEKAIDQAVETFWESVQKAIRNIAHEAGGSFERKKRRLIRFYDTSDHDLRDNDYILRERIDEDDNEREVTLKFRHPDRFLSMSCDMSAASAEDAETKFEEDIKPPFQSLYSHSTTQPIVKDKKLKKLADPFGLFPNLRKQLQTIDGKKNISVVGKLTVREFVFKGASFRISSRPKLEAECALILWYDTQGDDQRPEIAEFSFRYGDDDENYAPQQTRSAYQIYRCLQEPALSDWIDVQGMTKTAAVYDRA